MHDKNKYEIEGTVVRSYTGTNDNGTPYVYGQIEHTPEKGPRLFVNFKAVGEMVEKIPEIGGDVILTGKVERASYDSKTEEGKKIWFDRLFVKAVDYPNLYKDASKVRKPARRSASREF